MRIYMKKRIFALVAASIAVALFIVGCSKASEAPPAQSSSSVHENNNTLNEDDTVEDEPTILLTSKITELENGFSAVSFVGDDGFEDFLMAGGASSDEDIVKFLSSHLLADFDVVGSLFGCSTLAVQSSKGEALFGRNFDWQNCDALVVSSKPETGYASISTVNMDFISQSGGAVDAILKMNDVRTLAALYAPLDGMNEAGFTVAVNMIEDSATIEQNTQKPDITTTTAIRLLLNKAANVEEALALLEQYDMHGSMGMMAHFAMADASGRSVAVEYISNEMVVTQTPVVTNFYLAQGEKNGIGSSQSHERYDILMKALDENETMSMEDVRNALNSVSKDNFNEFESTEWSIVFNLDSGKAYYYHRENYEKPYVFKIN